MAPFKLIAKEANSSQKLLNKKLTVKLSDQKNKKNPLRMMKLLFALDVMEQR